MTIRRKRVNRTGVFTVDNSLKDLTTLWVLRLIIRVGIFDEFLNKNGNFRDDMVAQFLGYGRYVDSDDDIDRAEIKKSMSKKLSRLEARNSFSSDETLEKNLDLLSQKLELSQIQRDYLRLILMIKNYTIVENAFDMISELNFKQYLEVSSIVLDTPLLQLKKEMGRNTKLYDSGVLEINRAFLNCSFSDVVDFSDSEFASKIFSPIKSIDELMEGFVVEPSEPLLKLKDFTHIKDDIDMLKDYLEQSTQSSKKGVNILLYGEPGTGKTELVKTVAKTLGLNLLEIAYYDEDKEPMSRDKRLKAYSAAQSFFGESGTIFLFDEIEDIFSGGGLFFGNIDKVYKAWINRMLENNTTPTVWISNSIGVIDDAMIRRFDMALEIPIPPRSIRESMVRRYSDDMLDDATVKKVAMHESLSPGIIQRASKVAKTIVAKEHDLNSSFTKLAENTLVAQGYEKFDRLQGLELPPSYNPNYIHTDIAIEEAVEGIKEAKSARLCLYGAPGTGKSALGRYIAEVLDKPLLLKKGSDLLSKWLGGTEKNIARAFEEARDEDAVLLFDEVDSFLADRRDASRSWEVSQVNEMLTQMESFEGVFVATTNLKENLDQASLRRFDLKLEFRYLKPAQALGLFTIEAKNLGLSKLPKNIKDSISKLPNLAPGDFAAIKRQARFRPIKSAGDFLERIKAELDAKESCGKKMGFVS